MDSLLLQHYVVHSRLDSKVEKVGVDRVVESEKQSELLAAVLQSLAVLELVKTLPSCQLLAARQKAVWLAATVPRDWLLKLQHLLSINEKEVATQILAAYSAYLQVLLDSHLPLAFAVVLDPLFVVDTDQRDQH